MVIVSLSVILDTVLILLHSESKTAKHIAQRISTVPIDLEVANLFTFCSTRNHVLTQMYQDITSEFRQELSSLERGKLISTRFFNLFDVIAAIPIMDPRIDTGMEIAHSKDRHKLKIVEASNKLDGSQLIGVLDLLVGAYVDYLNSKQITHIFACIYVIEYQKVGRILNV